MQKYKIVKIKELTENVREFVLFPSEHPIDPYTSGQFIVLYIYTDPENEDVWEESRPYSISSPPDVYPEIWLGIKLQGTFTHRLWELKENDFVGVEGPFGVYDFSGEDPIVMFAGGIGVTPIMSYLRHVDKNKMDREIILFYSCRTLSSNPYYEELKMIEERNDNVKIIFIFTRDENAPGEHQRINKEMFLKYVNSPEKYSYFICGSKGFAQTVKDILASEGVKSDRIHVEAW